MTTIGLITVNYKSSKDTNKLLESVEKIDQKNIKLIQYVVDSGSNDGTIEEIEKAYPNIKSIKSKINLGFAGGNNLGIKQAIKDGCDYILLINNDAIVNEKDFLTKLLASNGDVISPLVKYKVNNKETFDYGGKVDYIFGRNTHFHTKPNTDPDYFSGVCIFAKTRVFKATKGLDDGYFLYYEDADFCLRAKEKGFKLGFCPEASIFHNLSSSTNKIGKKKITIIANSHLRFCMRHLPLLSFPFYFSFNLYLRLKTLI